MLTVPNKQTAESAPVDILWESNYVRNNGKRGTGIRVAWNGKETPEGQVVVRNTIIEGTKHAGIWMTGNASESGLKIRFSDITLYDVAAGDPSHYKNVPIVLEPSLADAMPRQGNCEFDDIFIYESQRRERPVVRALDAERFEGWENISGTIHVSVPGTFYTELSNTNETFDLVISPMN